MIRDETADFLSRLARAIHLDAERLGSGIWCVTGGRAAHIVAEDASACDCRDHEIRRGPCKHILIVRLMSGDRETLRALRALVRAPGQFQAHQSTRVA